MTQLSGRPQPACAVPARPPAGPEAEQRPDTAFCRRVTFFSFLLCTLVVIHHADTCGFCRITQSSAGFAAFVYELERFCSHAVAEAAVPGFFLLSGYLFYRNLRPGQIPAKLKRRLFSLGEPYLCWNALRLLLVLLLTALPTFQGSAEPPARTLPAVLDAILFYRYNLGYWFMAQLILFTALAPLLFALLRARLPAAVLCAGLFVLIGLDPPFLAASPLKFDSLFYYVCGAAAARHLAGAAEQPPGWSRRAAPAGLALALVCYYAFSAGGAVVLYHIYRLIFPLSLWCFLARWEKLPVRPCMQDTFFVYSAHGTVLEGIVMLAFRALPRTAASALGVYLVSAPLALAGCLVCAELLRRIAPRIYRLLSGGR